MSSTPTHVRLARFEFLGSPQFVNALTAVIVGTAAGSFLLENLIGWAGLIGILSALVVLAAASAFMRRRVLDWQGILPISLLAFLGWSAVSVLWSNYHWVTIASTMYQWAFAMLGVYIALTRDMIQIVRIVGNVLRGALALSLVLEILSGILLDSPIRFLGIRGDLAETGPIQGIAGDSARLGILALIAAITFGIELRTKSVLRRTAIISLVGAGLVILFTHANVIMLIAGGVFVTALVIAGIRRVRLELRQPISLALLALGFVGACVALVVRSQLLGALQSSDQVTNRIGLWREALAFAELNGLQGWGWIGRWHVDIVPFLAFGQVRGNPYASAFNAFLDVWLQLGIIGVLVFCGLIGLALTRSWLLAVRQQSVVYLWPALTVIALIATSVTESAILVEFAWLMLVICVVKSANKLSWRLAFERIRPTPVVPDLRER